MNALARQMPAQTRRRIDSAIHELLGATDALRKHTPDTAFALESILDALAELHGVKLDVDELEGYLDEPADTRASLGPL